jgi:hypothetical protein
MTTEKDCTHQACTIDEWLYGHENPTPADVILLCLLTGMVRQQPAAECGSKRQPGLYGRRSGHIGGAINRFVRA